MEYIIQELTNDGIWCLYRLAGKTMKTAQDTLKASQEKEPNKQFRIKEVESKDCWWNDPFLCN